MAYLYSTFHTRVDKEVDPVEQSAVWLAHLIDIVSRGFERYMR